MSETYLQHALDAANAVGTMQCDTEVLMVGTKDAYFIHVTELKRCRSRKWDTLFRVGLDWKGPVLKSSVVRSLPSMPVTALIVQRTDNITVFCMWAS